MISAAKFPWLENLGRHKALIVLTALGVSLAGLAIAVFWPPTYEADATILIEEPDIPTDVVKATMFTFVDQRLQVINQRVMTTANLVALIRRYNLYPNDRDKTPLVALAERLHNSLQMNTVSADVTDPSNGRPSKATIAFTLSFQNRNPQVARDLLNDVVSLFLSENLRSRREQVTSTNSFLIDQSKRLSDRIQQLGEQIAEFKAHNAGSLPDEATMTWQSMDRTQRDLEDVNHRIEALVDQRTYAQAELAATDPYAGTPANATPQTPAEQLRASEAQLATMRATYGEHYPDVVRLKRQVEGLRAALGTGPDASDLEPQLQALEQQRLSVLQHYSPAHPDVVALDRKIRGLKQAIAKAQASGAAKLVQNPTNPNYLRLRSQLQSINSELSGLQKQGVAIRDTLERYAKLSARAPEVERQYTVLQREYDEALQQLKDIQSKQVEAQLAQSVEVEQKGERFTILEPPVLPQIPVSPNRWAIIVISVAMGVGAGIGLALILGNVDGRVHGVQGLTQSFGVAPLVAIPLILTNGDKRRIRAQRLGFGGAALLASFTVLVLVHLFVMPLDVLWSVLERRFTVM